MIGPRWPGPVSVVTNSDPALAPDRLRTLSVGTWNDGSLTKVATPAARSFARARRGNASPSPAPAAAPRNSRRVRFTTSDPTDPPYERAVARRNRRPRTSAIAPRLSGKRTTPPKTTKSGIAYQWESRAWFVAGLALLAGAAKSFGPTTCVRFALG